MLPQEKKRLRRFQIFVRKIPRLGLLVVNPKFQWFALTGRITADALVEKVLPLLRRKAQLKPSVA